MRADVGSKNRLQYNPRAQGVQVPQAVLPNASTKNDMVRLVECCINAPESIQFEILYGLSNSDYRWVDLKHSEDAVGYLPEDSIHLEA